MLECNVLTPWGYLVNSTDFEDFCLIFSSIPFPQVWYEFDLLLYCCWSKRSACKVLGRCRQNVVATINICIFFFFTSSLSAPHIFFSHRRGCPRFSNFAWASQMYNDATQHPNIGDPPSPTLCYIWGTKCEKYKNFAFGTN